MAEKITFLEWSFIIAFIEMCCCCLVIKFSIVLAKLSTHIHSPLNNLLLFFLFVFDFVIVRSFMFVL